MMNVHALNMHDPWRDRLSEYLDDDLAAADRAALEAHLTECDDCRATLAELREVITLARNLEDRAPARDLWTGIRDRIGFAAAGDLEVVADLEVAADLTASPRGGAVPFRRRPPRRFSFTIPQLAAAGIALVFLTGSAVWFLGTGPGGGGTVDGVGAPGPGGTATANTPGAPAIQPGAPATPRFASHLATDLAGAQYDAAIADLQQALAAGRELLAPATIAVLEENLKIIDRAIDEARDALAEDPANVYLTNYLTDTMRRKLELLRYTNTIVRAQS